MEGLKYDQYENLFFETKNLHTQKLKHLFFIIKEYLLIKKQLDELENINSENNLIKQQLQNQNEELWRLLKELSEQQQNNIHISPNTKEILSINKIDKSVELFNIPFSLPNEVDSQNIDDNNTGSK